MPTNCKWHTNRKTETVLRKKMNTSNKEIIKRAPSINTAINTNFVPIYVKKQNTVRATQYCDLRSSSCDILEPKHFTLYALLFSAQLTYIFVVYHLNFARSISDIRGKFQWYYSYNPCRSFSMGKPNCIDDVAVS